MTARSQFETLKWALVFFIGNIGVLYWFGFDMIAVRTIGICLLVYYLPVVYIHYTYWRLNRGEEYLINRNEIVRIKDGREEVFAAEDIEKTIVYKSRNLSKGGAYFALGLYYYARIILRSGDELVITCLVIPDIDKVIRRLKGVPSELKVRTPSLLKRK